jgi:hypothetical protein
MMTSVGPRLAGEIHPSGRLPVGLLQVVMALLLLVALPWIDLSLKARIGA